MITTLLIVTSVACSICVGLLLARKSEAEVRKKKKNKNKNRNTNHVNVGTSEALLYFSQCKDLQHTVDMLHAQIKNLTATNQEYLGMIQEQRKEIQGLRRFRELPIMELDCA